MRLMYDALSSIHYEPKDFNDDLSSQVFDFYIKFYVFLEVNVIENAL